MFETDAAILLSDEKYSSPMWKKVIVCCLLIFCFGSLYVILANLVYRKEFITQSTDDLRNKGNIKYIRRDDWELKTRRVNIPEITQPACYVVISHTATSNCSGLMSCTRLVRSIRNNQVRNESHDDVHYNFLIGNVDGIFVGRGWNLQPYYSYNYESNSISVAFIGNFSKIHPTDLQLDNLKRLIEDGIKEKKIDEHYKLLGHKQFNNTDSPGQFLYDVIKTWEHWSPI